MPYPFVSPAVMDYVTNRFREVANADESPLRADELDNNHGDFVGLKVQGLAACTLFGITTQIQYAKEMAGVFSGRSWDTMEQMQAEIDQYYNTHPYRQFVAMRINEYIPGSCPLLFAPLINVLGDIVEAIPEAYQERVVDGESYEPRREE